MSFRIKMWRLIVIFLFAAISNSVFCQKRNVEYRTYSEDSIGLHYLTFSKDGKCTIRFPGLQTHGNAMLGTKAIFFMGYATKNDAISFLYPSDLDSTQRLFRNLIKSQWVIKEDGKLLNDASGQFYVDRKTVPEQHLIYIIDNNIYKVRIPKTNADEIVTKSYRGNRKLRKKLENVDLINYQFNIIKGKMAFDKYGIIGMNGVIEVVHK